MWMWSFNAARPEGRESVVRNDADRVQVDAASMLPAPKGGSRGTPVGPPLILDLRFNAARPEGRESVVLLGSGERVGAASMLPAPKGGSRVDPSPQPG